MATFASSSLSKRAAGEAGEEDGSSNTSATPIYEPKKLLTTEVGSIFQLKSEIYKKRADLVKTSLSGEYQTGKKGILAVKKEEKQMFKSEAAERKARIRELEREIRKEDEQRIVNSTKKLHEKADLYDKLTKGKITMPSKDDISLEFMVDFNAKKKELDDEARLREAVQKAPDPTPGTSNPSKAAPVERFAPEEERRVYGVGHMSFSTDETKRKEEIEALKELSRQTEKTREKHQTVVEQREQMRKDKIAKMRKRLGLPELKEPTPPPEPNLGEIPMPVEPEETPQQQFEKRMKSDREWDRGKDRFNQWVEKQREDRDDDFRPPDSYFR